MFSSLTALDLSSNALSSLSHLGVLSKTLVKLSLANNSLDSFASLFSPHPATSSSSLAKNKVTPFPRLTHLNLAGNTIRRIPPFLATAAPALSSLRLDRNAIGYLRDVESLSHLANLTLLTLHSNPMSDLPHARAFVVFSIPSLNQLDGEDVTGGERAAASARFSKTELQVFQDALDSQSELNHDLEDELGSLRQSLAQAEAQAARSSADAAATAAELARTRVLAEEKEALLVQTTSELNKTSELLYEVEQELAFFKIEASFAPPHSSSSSSPSSALRAKPPPPGPNLSSIRDETSLDGHGHGHSTSSLEDQESALHLSLELLDIHAALREVDAKSDLMSERLVSASTQLTSAQGQAHVHSVAVEDASNRVSSARRELAALEYRLESSRVNQGSAPTVTPAQDLEDAVHALEEELTAELNKGDELKAKSTELKAQIRTLRDLVGKRKAELVALRGYRSPSSPSRLAASHMQAELRVDSELAVLGQRISDAEEAYVQTIDTLELCVSRSRQLEDELGIARQILAGGDVDPSRLGPDSAAKVNAMVVSSLATRQSQLGDALASAQEDLASASAVLTVHQQSMAKLDRETREYEAAVTSLDADRARLLSQLADKEAALRSLQSNGSPAVTAGPATTTTTTPPSTDAVSDGAAAGAGVELSLVAALDATKSQLATLQLRNEQLMTDLLKARQDAALFAQPPATSSVQGEEAMRAHYTAELAEAAAHVGALTEERDSLKAELDSMSHHVDALSKDLDSMTQDRDALAAEQKRLVGDVGAAQKECVSLNEQVRVSHAQVMALQESERTLKAMVEAKDSRLIAESTLHDRPGEMADQLAALERRLEEQSKLIETYEAKPANRSAELSSMVSEGLDAMMTSLDSLAQTRLELDQAQDELRRANATIQELRAANGALKSANLELREELVQIESQPGLGETSGLDVSLDIAAQMIDSNATAAEEAQVARDAAQSHVASLEAELQALATAQAEANQESQAREASVRADLRIAQKQVATLQAELASASARADAAEEALAAERDTAAALSESLHSEQMASVVAAAKEARLAELAAIINAHFGSKLSLSALSSGSGEPAQAELNELKSLLDALSSDVHHTTPPGSPAPLPVASAEVEGAVPASLDVSAHLDVLERARDERSKALDSLAQVQRALSETEAALAARKVELDTQTSLNESLSVEQAAADAELDRIRAAVADEQAKLTALKTEVRMQELRAQSGSVLEEGEPGSSTTKPTTSAFALLTELQEQIAETSASHARAKDQLRQTQTDLEVKTAALEATKDAAGQLRVQVNDLEAQAAVVRKELQSYSEAQRGMAAVMDVESRRNAVAKLEAERDALKTELATLSQAAASASSQAETQASAKAQEAAARMEEHANALDELLTRVASAQEELTGLEEERDVLNAEIKETRENGLHALERDLESLRETHAQTMASLERVAGWRAFVDAGMSQLPAGLDAPLLDVLCILPKARVEELEEGYALCSQLEGVVEEVKARGGAPVAVDGLKCEGSETTMMVVSASAWEEMVEEKEAAVRTVAEQETALFSGLKSQIVYLEAEVDAAKASAEEAGVESGALKEELEGAKGALAAAEERVKAFEASESRLESIVASLHVELEAKNMALFLAEEGINKENQQQRGGGVRGREDAEWDGEFAPSTLAGMGAFIKYHHERVASLAAEVSAAQDQTKELVHQVKHVFDAKEQRYIAKIAEANEAVEGQAEQEGLVVQMLRREVAELSGGVPESLRGVLRDVNSGIERLAALVRIVREERSGLASVKDLSLQVREKDAQIGFLVADLHSAKQELVISQKRGAADAALLKDLFTQLQKLQEENFRQAAAAVRKPAVVERKVEMRREERRAVSDDSVMSVRWPSEPVVGPDLLPPWPTMGSPERGGAVIAVATSPEDLSCSWVAVGGGGGGGVEEGMMRRWM